MKTVVSGARPTNQLHLGNYLGAVKNFVHMQKDYRCFFFIADYHSLTTHPKPIDLQNNVKQTLAEYLACGLDADQSTIYVQSDVPEINELYLILNMLAYKGELEKATTYKDKISKQKTNINAGLLTYPVLMAADILIHKATLVPVGKDQEQHLEMTRNFGNRFNHLYECSIFPEPHAFNNGEELIKVPALHGKGKMSKSDPEKFTIFLTDSNKTIENKVKKATTDSGPVAPNQPKSKEIESIFNLMKAVSDKETQSFYEKAYDNCSIRYGDMKKQIALDTIRIIEPIREKINQIKSNNTYMAKVAKQGAEKARESAFETLKEVKQAVGLKSFSI